MAVTNKLITQKKPPLKDWGHCRIQQKVYSENGGQPWPWSNVIRVLGHGN